MSVPTSSKRTFRRLFPAFLLSAHLSFVTAEIAILYSHSYALPNILELPSEQSCAISVDGLTSTPFPWTHNPTCINGYCVYTNSRFANNRGISIVTSPEVATNYTLESFSREFQDDWNSPDLPYEPRDMPEKGGIGLFAKERIAAGDTIMLKHPVVVLHRDLVLEHRTQDRIKLLEIAINHLPKQGYELMKGLAKSLGGDEVDDVFKTNAKNLRLEGNVPHLAVIPEAARINHACRPNAFHRFDDFTLTLDVFATRDIEPGEELSISFGYSSSPYSVRQEAIQSQWGFTCTCSLCSAPTKTLDASDARLSEIASMKQALPSGHENIPQLIAILPNLISLLDQEGLVLETPMYAEILAYCWSALGIEERAKKWGTKALQGWSVVAGRKSWEAKRMKEFVEGVKSHPSWATWDKDPWDDSVWEDDDHHDHEHEHDHDHEHGHGHDHSH